MPSAALKAPVLDEAGAPPEALAAGARLSFRVFESLEAAEPVWRDLEADAVLTPYQRFDWISELVRAGKEDKRLAIIVIDADGEPVALLPLGIDRRLGVRRAEIIGADVSNGDWMVLLPRAARLLTRERLEAVLRSAGKSVGIDLIALYGQPKSWAGCDNPLLAFPHQESPDHFHFGTIGERRRFDQFDDKRLSHLLRRKRKLAEAVGEVTLKRATNVEEIDTTHRAFLEQRSARFARMGIANVFAEPEFVRFFRDGAIASLGSARPALIFHALFAGETIVATACGTFAGDHYSQYINATAGGEIAKFRLIGLLMHELFLDVAAMGATSIDMGLGDFDYKSDWTLPLTAYDGMIPLTLHGRLAGGTILAARRAKRAIKQHDRLWSLVRKLRATLGRRTQPQPSD